MAKRKRVVRRRHPKSARHIQGRLLLGILVLVIAVLIVMRPQIDDGYGYALIAAGVWLLVIPVRELLLRSSASNLFRQSSARTVGRVVSRQTSESTDADGDLVVSFVLVVEFAAGGKVLRAEAEVDADHFYAYEKVDEVTVRYATADPEVFVLVSESGQRF